MGSAAGSFLYFKRGGAPDTTQLYARPSGKYDLRRFRLKWFDADLNGIGGLVDDDGFTIYDHSVLTTILGSNVGTSPETAIVVTGEPAAPAAVASTAGVDRTYEYLKQLRTLSQIPSIHELKDYLASGLQFKDGSPALLPVHKALYDQLTRSSPRFMDILQPEEACGAGRLAAVISAALWGAKWNDPTDEVVVAGYVDTVLWDILHLMAEVLDSPQTLKRKRNAHERSSTLALMRPDFMILVNHSLLMKGEDKASDDDLLTAQAELVNKLPEWSTAYHAKVPYLLSYVCGGLTLRFGALDRLNNTFTTLLANDFDMSRKLHRALAIRTSMQLYPVVMQLAKALPGDVALGHTKVRPNGTSIFYGDTYVDKTVDLNQQRSFMATADTMPSVYRAVVGCQQLIQSAKEPCVRGNTYSVRLKPRATEMSSISGALLRGAQLVAAVRCILQALVWLHARSWCHGDLRWDIVIQETADNFRVIDLESAVKSGSKPDPPFPAVWGTDGEALVEGEVTVVTDLYLVGGMMRVAGVSDELGVQLMNELLAKRIASSQAALEHPWFTTHP